MENMTCPLCSRKIRLLKAATEYQNILKGAWVCWHCEIIYPLEQPHNPVIKRIAGSIGGACGLSGKLPRSQ